LCSVRFTATRDSRLSSWTLAGGRARRQTQRDCNSKNEPCASRCREEIVEKQEPPKHWDSVKDLFGAALEVERELRGAFLLDACGSNESMRAEIESLLSAYEKSSELSQSPWSAAASQTAAPQFVGPYQLLEKLGEGGMGQVWLAEQSAPVRRRVALKLIRTGLYDNALLQRFQAERQSLAIMDHPSIAKVFDAGTTEAGQPYFVMEYVP